MKIHFKRLIFLVFYLSLCLRASASDTCRVMVDLINVKDDKVKVIVYPASTPGKNAEYVMPAVIPGSYSIKDFGRFISSFQAFDAKGKKLQSKRTSPNIFQIKKGDQLHRIEYMIDDTWDAPNDNFIFQPGGTNIDVKRNFVINHQGFYGYFENQKMVPYKITYLRPKELYSVSSIGIKREEDHDVAISENYVRLVDHPIMIGQIDTISFQLANMRIHIGVFSENGYIGAQQVKPAIEPLAKALQNFFGTFPVDHYHFIMYFAPRKKEGVSRYGGFGALEHSYSSFYFLPELNDPAMLTDMIQSIAGHEFLHILTPLNIHSEEIETFDFRNPKMSQHLWLYEGVTEYFAQLIRIQENLIDEKGFMLEIKSKIENARSYPSVSFTEMSKNILQEPFKAMYSNVYDKGALLAMLLDIRLQELSDGKTNLRNLLLQLAAKYGPRKPFQDDQLFGEIIRLSFPEINDYFNRFLIGNEELPYKSYFEKIGWEYYSNQEVTFLSFGELHLYPNRNTGEVIALGCVPEKNEFGLRDHDILLSINGIEVKPGMDSLMELIEEPEHEQEISLEIRRDGVKLTERAHPKAKTEIKRLFIRKSRNLTSSQDLFRRRFFKSR